MQCRCSELQRGACYFSQTQSRISALTLLHNENKLATYVRLEEIAMLREDEMLELTTEDQARMNAREAELTARYDKARQEWKEFVERATDEEIVRAYLASRVVVWQQLPYDWMDMDVEALDSWNIIDYPPEVEAAYERSRADPKQRAKYEDDYDRGPEATDEWLKELESR